MSNKHSHPMQPVVMTEDRTAVFQKNAIVETLLNLGPLDMNKLSMMDFSPQDRSQFAQLIGYTVSGYGELPYADPMVVAAADHVVEQLIKHGGAWGSRSTPDASVRLEAVRGGLAAITEALEAVEAAVAGIEALLAHLPGGGE